MPCLTVCIPVYNNSKTILETLDSVKNQRFGDYTITPDVEILIVDDFSTDDTIQKIESSGMKYTLYRRIKNEGLASSLNYFSTVVSEDTIMVYLAGDDYLLPNALQTIWKEFDKNSQLGILSRPYYWFKDDWRKPIRWTKRKNFGIIDLIFLCGQMSGIAIRKSMLETQFAPKTFIEFASVALPIIKKYDSKLTEEPTVAIRTSVSESRSAWVYESSPTTNWHEIMWDNFNDNPELILYLENKLARNYIGLLQIRMYAGWKKAMAEVGVLIDLDATILFHYKFWFYLFLIQLPALLLKFGRNLIL